MPPVKSRLNMPVAIGSDMNWVGVPPTVPDDVLAVAMLVVAFPNWQLKGVGVVPPVTVPPEYKMRVAAEVVPPEILEIYKDRPLKLGFVIWTSWFEPPAIAALAVVTIKSLPLLEAFVSGGAIDAEVLYGLLMSI
ncbi:hypothetical protein A7975_22055 [Bacillus sp. FJAT-26390]|nr:hypothetical protein A7975_22055 [Bacillus sp. FJAT-26390]